MFVMGTRWDLAPHPRPEEHFTHICATCKAVTYTEKAFPENATVVCNVCASTASEQADASPDTLLVWDLPPDLLKNLLVQAQQQGIHPENFVIGFLNGKQDGSCRKFAFSIERISKFTLSRRGSSRRLIVLRRTQQNWIRENMERIGGL